MPKLVHLLPSPNCADSQSANFCRFASYYGDYHVEPGLKDIHDHAWNDERYFASPYKGDRKFVSIDSHILCTPVIADIDADGRDELVVAATYFFDNEYYDKPVSPVFTLRLLLRIQSNKSK